MQSKKLKIFLKSLLLIFLPHNIEPMGNERIENNQVQEIVLMYVQILRA